MAGTKGMQSGNPWQYHMNPEAIEGAFIDYMCGKEKFGRSTWTFKYILIHFEKEAREYMGDELYEKFLAKHNKNVIEQTKERDEAKAKEESKDKELEVKSQFLQAETIRMQDKHEERIEQKPQASELAEKRHRPSEDEKILSMLEEGESRLTPEQLQDSEFMAKRHAKIADLKQKIAQSEPKP